MGGGNSIRVNTNGESFEDILSIVAPCIAWVNHEFPEVQKGVIRNIRCIHYHRREKNSNANI